MKKDFLRIICFSALVLLSLQSFAQEKDRKDSRPPFDKEEFVTKRNAYLIEKIGLTEEEVATFIPLENELMNKKFEVGRECHKLERELRKKENKADAEFDKLLKCREEVKEKRDKLDKEYLDKFKKLLSAEKIIKYQSADRAFFEEFFQNRNR
ncbi:MAG: hypothetical protein LBT35_06525 [Tannerella sp.]|nr:hypothetical protein [Tannerella sp.]